MTSTAEEVTVRNRKPKDSKFKQQALPAWQPILTAGTVLPTFFVIGIAFIPIGIGLLYFSQQVHEVEIPYHECTNAAGDFCYEVIKNTGEECTCILEVNNLGSENWVGKVFIYYGLTNFYQNHRRYVKSRDDNQLLGNVDKEPSTDCDPFKTPDTNDTEAKGKFYAPCGAIANSMFNDEIVLQYRRKENSGSAASWKKVPVHRTGIAWESDKSNKFGNPANGSVELEEILRKYTVKPKDWKKELWELDPTNPSNNGFQNEDLIVWMRTAALPNFRKLYRRVDHDNELQESTYDGYFKEGLPVKEYEYRLVINYNFKVIEFAGTKTVIISTTSLLGGKNNFLGIAYIVVGCICLAVGIMFLLIHLKYGRTTAEMMNISPELGYASKISKSL